MLGNGHSLHVAFSPLTGGGSVYYTDNETIQAALEKHHHFGKLFREEAIEEPKEEAPVEVEAGSSKIMVKDIDEAKEYLCEHYGLSRTKLKTLAAVEAAAAANGIAFDGIN